MEPLGIISGTISMGRVPIEGLREKFCETDFGHAVVWASDEAVFVPRHGTDPDNHILPHLINCRANMVALQDLGVSEVIAVNSTGSLNVDLKPGMIVIPDDFICLSASPTVFSFKPMHITPALSPGVRMKLLKAARDCGAETADGGVYWQTAGPRLETRAEIRLMSRFADLVGMTMANEAVIANELDMRYASLCSVDNFAHGLVDNPLELEEILANAQRNQELVMKIIRTYVETRRSQR